MSDAHTTTIDRLRQFSTARRGVAADCLKDAQQNDAAARGTFPDGTRVLDRETGLEGAVVDRQATFSAAGVAMYVRLDRGDTVVRFASELLVRPTPPTV